MWIFLKQSSRGSNRVYLDENRYGKKMLRIPGKYLNSGESNFSIGWTEPSFQKDQPRKQTQGKNQGQFSLGWEVSEDSLSKKMMEHNSRVDVQNSQPQSNNLRKDLLNHQGQNNQESEEAIKRKILEEYYEKQRAREQLLQREEELRKYEEEQYCRKWFNEDGRNNANENEGYNYNDQPQDNYNQNYLPNQAQNKAQNIYANNNKIYSANSGPIQNVYQNYEQDVPSRTPVPRNQKNSDIFNQSES